MADDEKPRVSDAEMLARFQNSKKRPPCSDTLGMRLAEVDQDAQRIRMDFDVSSSFANPTLTLIALTLRLAARIAEESRASVR